MNFRILLFYFLIGTCICCTSDNSRCGEIIDKQIVNGKYYLILNAESAIFNTNSNEPNSFIPDSSVSGEVSASDYNRFSIGEEYCSE